MKQSLEDIVVYSNIPDQRVMFIGRHLRYVNNKPPGIFQMKSSIMLWRMGEKWNENTENEPFRDCL